jgi:hypothetical protein
MTETVTADPVAELAALQIKVWRYAVDTAADRDWDADEALAGLGLPDSDVDDAQATDEIWAWVRSLRSADVPDLLAAYPNRVRAAAAKAAEEMDWCSYGLNQALRELDLPGWDGMRAWVAADVRLVDTDEKRELLTVETLTPLLKAYSEDEDVVVVQAPAVDLVGYDADTDAALGNRQLTASVRVRVRLADVVRRVTAEDWIARSVLVEPYSEHVGLALHGYYLDHPRITWDGDAPDL